MEKLQKLLPILFNIFKNMAWGKLCIHGVRGIGPPGAGVTCGCELPYMGPGDQILRKQRLWIPGASWAVTLPGISELQFSKTP